MLAHANGDVMGGEGQQVHALPTPIVTCSGIRGYQTSQDLTMFQSAEPSTLRLNRTALGLNYLCALPGIIRGSRRVSFSRTRPQICHLSICSCEAGCRAVIGWAPHLNVECPL